MPSPPLAPLGLFLSLAVPLGLAAFALCYRRAGRVYGGFERFLWAAGAAGLFLIFFALHQHYFPQGVDDSFISYRYSEHVAQGYGFVTNPGERVEGFSNPLWVLLLAGLAKLGCNQASADWALPLAAKLLGIVCDLATFWLIFFWGTRARRSWLPAVTGLSWLVAAGANSFWAVTGLETAAHSLLLLWAALAWSDLSSDSPLPAHPVQLVTALALLVISRPEGALFGVVLLGLWYYADKKVTRPWLISTVAFAALCHRRGDFPPRLFRQGAAKYVLCQGDGRSALSTAARRAVSGAGADGDGRVAVDRGAAEKLARSALCRDSRADSGADRVCALRGR